MKLYGLFSYSYDYYEWETLAVASDYQSKLIDYFHDNCKDSTLAFSETHHVELAEKEFHHLYIKEIDFV